MPKITIDLPGPDTARARLLTDLVEHNPNKQQADDSIEGRLAALEHNHREQWYLMLAVIQDNLAYALNPEEAAIAPATEELPFIEDKESFVSYVSMVTRLLKQGTISAAEARAMLYGAQLTFAALREGGKHDHPAPQRLP